MERHVIANFEGRVKAFEAKYRGNDLLPTEREIVDYEANKQALVAIRRDSANKAILVGVIQATEQLANQIRLFCSEMDDLIRNGETNI